LDISEGWSRAGGGLRFVAEFSLPAVRFVPVVFVVAVVVFVVVVLVVVASLRG